MQWHECRFRLVGRQRQPGQGGDPEASLLQELGPEDFERQSRRVRNEGLEVDEELWARLKTLVGRMPVEESEESRRHGAGVDAP